MLRSMKGAAASVYLALATRQNESGIAPFPADVLAEDTGYGRTAIYDALKHLQALGAIEGVIAFQVGRGMIKGWRLCMLEEESAPADSVRPSGLENPPQRTPEFAPADSLSRSIKQNQKSRRASPSAAVPLECSQLADFFATLTSLSRPEPKTSAECAAEQRLWWTPLREILQMVEGRATDAEALLQEAFARLTDRADPLTVASPNSLLKTARAISAEVASGRFRQRGMSVVELWLARHAAGETVDVAETPKAAAEPIETPAQRAAPMPAASAARVADGPPESTQSIPGGDDVQIPEQIFETWTRWRGEPPSPGQASSLSWYIERVGQGAVLEGIRSLQAERVADVGPLFLRLGRSPAFSEAETPSSP
ncbi:MAG: hypothetical protein ACRDHG_01785 [Anaerolineales bacterium]